jgi:hypothetical protein
MNIIIKKYIIIKTYIMQGSENWSLTGHGLKGIGFNDEDVESER